MTDKCQAPGLECEDCRLNCQLPLIEAEKAQRERRDNEINRLQVALEATIKEKERCRLLAVDYALKADSFEIALQRCENMKLAHEFEDLLQTTSIPVAVEKLKELIAINAQIDSLLENWQAWSTCVAPDEMIQEYWRRFVDSMINLVTMKGVSK